MVGSFFSGLSKVAKIIFIAGFVLAILICLVVFSYFRGDGGTNKHDTASVQAQTQAQVEIVKEGTVNKATIDETKKMELEMELKKLELLELKKLEAERKVVDENYIEKLKAERGTLDVNKKMELEYQKEVEEKQAKAKAAQAKAAAQAAAARARAAAQKAEMEMLKALGD